MKKVLLLFILAAALEAHSQDTAKIKQIDQLVNIINNSQFTIHTDSTTQDLSQLNLWMRTYVTAVTDSIYLKKFTNKVFAKREENGVMEQTITSSSFYFDQGKLIKVEESIIEDDGKEGYAEWYYADDKPLYYTLHREGSEERANLLLNIAKTILKPFNN